MSQKLLITTFLLLFITSALFLFWQNDRGLDPDRAGSWWTLSFADPKSPASLSFIIENHSDQTRFNYRVVSEKQTLSESSFIVERGKSITITPEQQATPSTRTSIIVSDGTGSKEIYR